MVPSALAPVSAPTRVRRVPSCLASSAVTAAAALPSTASSAPARRVLANVMVCSSAKVWSASERGLEGEDHEAAIRQQRVGATVRGDGVGGVGGGVAEE